MSDEWIESDVRAFTGWKCKKNGNTRRYVSPGGIEISKARFDLLSTRYAGQSYIPESEILEPPKEKALPKSPKILSELPEEDSNIFSLPEAKPKPGKSSGSRASAREISTSVETTLLILTSAIALLFGAGELAMKDEEAKAIAIPFANIFESTKMNEKFGRLFASSGDYQLLGYALYLYGFRVFSSLSEKNDITGKANKVKRTTTNTSGGGQSGGGGTTGYAGASLPYRGTSPIRTA